MPLKSRAKPKAGAGGKVKTGVPKPGAKPKRGGAPTDFAPPPSKVVQGAKIKCQFHGDGKPSILCRSCHAEAASQTGWSATVWKAAKTKGRMIFAVYVDVATKARARARRAASSDGVATRDAAREIVRRQSRAFLRYIERQAQLRAPKRSS